MAAGPIYPSSAYPADTAARLFPVFYGGAGGNAAPHDEGLGVKASLDADATWELRFQCPPVIPSGTLKLRNLMLVSGPTTQVIKYTVQDATVSAGSSPSAATLTSETQTSHTFSSGDTDKYIEIKTPLTASPSGNDMLVVAVTFNTTGWTLAVVLTNIFSIIWE